MTTQITVCVNGRDVQVVKAAEIDYHELCRLAHVPVEARPTVMYVAGPLRAGQVRYGERAPYVATRCTTWPAPPTPRRTPMALLARRLLQAMSLETYQEGPNSTFTHLGNTYPSIPSWWRQTIYRPSTSPCVRWSGCWNTARPIPSGWPRPI